jgi:ABC-type uncharacterized transport system permease subunit
LLAFVNWLLPLLYLGVLIDYGAAFFLRRDTHARKPWLAVVVGLHLLFLVARGLQQGAPPLDTSHELLSLVAVATALVYLVVEFASRDRRTGVFVLLPVFLFQYTCSTFLMHSFTVPAAAQAQSTWARLHVVPAVLAYTGLTIAAVYGLLHLLAQRDLKQHRFGLLFDRLPSLDLLSKMTWQALLVGFLFMTVVIVTGPFLVRHTEAVQQDAAWAAKVGTKIVIGSIAWLTYLAAVIGKAVRKWPASRISGIAVGGFFVIMVLLGTSMILS